MSDTEESAEESRCLKGTFQRMHMTRYSLGTVSLHPNDASPRKILRGACVQSISIREVLFVGDDSAVSGTCTAPDALRVENPFVRDFLSSTRVQLV